MLDLKYLRQHAETAAQALSKKGHHFDIDAFKSLDQARKAAETAEQQLLADRKQASKQVGVLIKEGVPVEEAKAQVADTLQEIEAKLGRLKEESKTAGEAMDALLMGTPNVPDDAVPEGADESDNQEILSWGEIPSFDFEVKDHVALGEQLGGLDFERATQLVGARFAVMSGGVARLHRALAQFMLDLHTVEHGYTEMNVPVIVNEASLRGTGQLPKFEEDLFKLEGDQGWYLIPTAEVPVTNLLREQIIEDADLGEGLKMAAHTTCFRSEAGSYGRDTRGMIRQHQFEKIELVQWVRPADSEAALEALTGHAEKVLQTLELPYRKVLLCGGDLGFSARKTYDLEVWLPAQSCYREISSCSNFGDYQARRMMARWRNPETGKPELLHSLNGSGLAVGRTLVAVLENGQRADGRIELPAALVPYMGGRTHLEPQ